ncbi:MAG: SLC13 family permease, partial [Acidiferrobacterales bacterium]|nr:SLC13 family permease [Acidiferrobacterales bacterium]
GVEGSGLLDMLGQELVVIAQDPEKLLQTALILLWVSAFLSAAVDNIPFTVTMIPIISHLETQGVDVMPLWWALALGVGLGGNGTHIGSTANVICVAEAERAGDPTFRISPLLWLKKGTPVMLVTLMVASILLVKYEAKFTLTILATLVAYIGYTLVITEWRMVFRRNMNEMDSKANTTAIDSLLNYETVKYFNNENYESSRYDENMERWEAAAIRNQTSLSVLNGGQSVIIAFGVTALMIMASQGVVSGKMTIGDLVLVNAFLLQLYQPLHFLGFVYREIRHSLADMEKMFDVLAQPPEVEDKPDAKELEIKNGVIRFEHVDFGYDPKRQILFDMDFEVPAGHKVAVVGHSGAGKSTISRLLFRFYDVNGGRILIDGQDIRDVAQASLRANIGIVPQDTVLFNDTIGYNIAYGKPDATTEEVIQAARSAHIHDFVESLPDKYETVVGERGLKLSGGEKQRVAIARTILKNPPILVFDEATSALDSKTEKGIQRELETIARNHTTLVIAHRLSTVMDADEILVLDGGRIIERGTHHQLLSQDGIYTKMWELQLQEKQEADLKAVGAQ